MKDRPIIFSAPMVRALLEGRKSQTRRAINPQPSFDDRAGFAWKGWCYGIGASDAETNRNFAYQKCPYGRPGDRLWVREAWRTDKEYDPYSPRQIDSAASLFMLADNCEYRINRRPECGPVEWGRYRHARFMPRWASRILLEITDVRVERLQDISEEDARAEGVDTAECCHAYYHGYRTLWESINGAGSWDLNPWVWAISFKRVAI